MGIPFIVLGAFILWRRACIPFALLSLISLYPILTFKKFAEPDNQNCERLECVSTIAINLCQDTDALANFAKSDIFETDIIFISELPYSVSKDQLGALFNLGETRQISYLIPQTQQIGSRLAIISKLPVSNIEFTLEKFPNTELLPRGILNFDVSFGTGHRLSIVAIHAPPPKTRAIMLARDHYLTNANRHISEKSDFILIGDFNMSPWEPGFKKLAGKCGGDPRWTRSWNA